MYEGEEELKGRRAHANESSFWRGESLLWRFAVLEVFSRNAGALAILTTIIRFLALFVVYKFSFPGYTLLRVA